MLPLSKQYPNIFKNQCSWVCKWQWPQILPGGEHSCHQKYQLLIIKCEFTLRQLSFDNYL